MTEQDQKNKILVSLRLTPETHRKARIKLFESDSSFQKFLSEKIEDLVR